MFISNKFNNILDEFNGNKNSHSYIFYTNDFFSCEKDVHKLIESIFNKDISLIQSDFVEVKKSDKKNILKNEIDYLKEHFKNTTYLNNKRIYLIEEAHKLNSTTSNMILKFLEEPENGIVGLFITDNLDSVINTIKSRCQVINVFYEIKNKNNINKELEKIEDVLFNKDKYISLINAKNEFGSFDRNELIDKFKNLLEIYYDKINDNNIHRIKVLNGAITLLNKNVNTDYVIDYILLKDSE